MTLQVQRNQRKRLIYDGRVYKVLAAHYAIRHRLQGRVWRGPLVDALQRRPKGETLRVAVARMYRQLKELGHEQCNGQDDRGAHGAGAGPAVLRHAGAAAAPDGEHAQHDGMD